MLRQTFGSTDVFDLWKLCSLDIGEDRDVSGLFQVHTVSVKSLGD